jgi:AcrR family transcriptional regulator
MTEVARGRPRSERARLAILAAAAELLLDRGLAAVSMDAVAARAGVSKATIYRWWPTKETLALDALYTEWAAAQPSEVDTGSLRGDLLSLLSPWARVASSRPYGRVIAALLSEAQTDPAYAAQYRQRVVQPRRDQARAILARAVERGEIPASTKTEVAIDLLYGPLYHRLLHGHAPLDDQFVEDVVDTALAGIYARALVGRDVLAAVWANGAGRGERAQHVGVEGGAAGRPVTAQACPGVAGGFGVELAAWRSAVGGDEDLTEVIGEVVVVGGHEAAGAGALVHRVASSRGYLTGYLTAVADWECLLRAV